MKEARQYTELRHAIIAARRRMRAASDRRRVTVTGLRTDGAVVETLVGPESARVLRVVARV